MKKDKERKKAETEKERKKPETEKERKQAETEKKRQSWTHARHWQLNLLAINEDLAAS